MPRIHDPSRRFLRLGASRLRDGEPPARRRLLPSDDPQPGYVYLIWAPGDQHKIGKSIHPPKRLRKMQLPYGSRIIHSIVSNDMAWAEETLHTRYAAERLPRGEWFRLSEAQVADICAITHMDRENP